VENFCFEAEVLGGASGGGVDGAGAGAGAGAAGGLFFDYKLRKGVAENMNASFLMQKMGIIISPGQ
jgi:hypothetical protein